MASALMNIIAAAVTYILQASKCSSSSTSPQSIHPNLPLTFVRCHFETLPIPLPTWTKVASMLLVLLMVIRLKHDVKSGIACVWPSNQSSWQWTYPGFLSMVPLKTLAQWFSVSRLCRTCSDLGAILSLAQYSCVCLMTGPSHPICCHFSCYCSQVSNLYELMEKQC